MKTFFAPVILALAFALAGCADTFIDKAREYGRMANTEAAKVGVQMLAGECARDEGQRRDLLDKINKEAKSKGAKFRAVAQDCVEPFDGRPDF